MSTSILVKSKAGQAHLINQFWQQQFGPTDFLIFDTDRIKEEVRSIQAGIRKDFDHLRPFVKSVSDWNDRFPAFAENCGVVFLPPDEVLFCRSIRLIRFLERKIRFLDANQNLFSQIEGIIDVSEKLNIKLSDAIVSNAHFTNLRSPQFNSVNARPNSTIYQLCKAHDAPALWQFFLNFTVQPCQVTWDKLKLQPVPWSGGIIEDNVWGLCELAARRSDGKDYGVAGRFINGAVPSEIELRVALLRTANKSTTRFLNSLMRS